MRTEVIILNLIMLMGLSLFAFKTIWATVFGILHAFWDLTGKKYKWPLHFFYVLWAYFLASQTVVAVKLVKMTKPALNSWLEGMGIIFYLLFLTADRIGWIWLAYRKLDEQLQKLAVVQNWMALGFLTYFLINLFIWPNLAYNIFATKGIYLIQHWLLLPKFGIFLGVIGILYEVRVITLIVKFIRVGPKGLPPFPKNLR